MLKGFERRKWRRKTDETGNLFDYSYHQSGSIPGTLRIKPHTAIPQIDAIDYTAETVIRSRNLVPIDCQEYLQTPSISWVDVAGVGDIDITETYRELASGLMDVYLSAVSNKMNEIMKVLTVISTIFIPLTFIVGVYGLNFNPDASP